MASQKRHLDVVKHLIECKADIDRAKNDGVTPLFMASQKGHLDIVKHFIECKADVDLSDNRDSTPLHIACVTGHLEVVQQLIQAFFNGRALCKSINPDEAVAFRPFSVFLNPFWPLGQVPGPETEKPDPDNFFEPDTSGEWP